MENKKIEEEAGRLQKSDDQNNMRPIWGFRRRPRTNTASETTQSGRQMEQNAMGMKETMGRWGECTAECFSKTKNQLTPKIEHINDLEWGK